MKLSILIPAIAAALALTACGDNEPVQPAPNAVPAPTTPVKPTTDTNRHGEPTVVSPTAVNDPPVLRGDKAAATGSPKVANGVDAATGTVANGDPAVLRGDKATEVGGAVKKAANGASADAAGVVAANDPAVLRGDKATEVGAPKTTNTVNSTTGNAAPVDGTTTVHSDTAPAAGNAESKLVPDRDAATKREAQEHATDDSGRNKREDGTQLTPLDQGESEADRTITQGIRKSVVDRDDLSVNAKNVKIITRNGVVTLRGPVADARERDLIASTATAQQGVVKVDNQLEPKQQ